MEAVVLSILVSTIFGKWKGVAGEEKRCHGNTGDWKAMTNGRMVGRT